MFSLPAIKLESIRASVNLSLESEIFVCGWLTAYNGIHTTNNQPLWMTNFADTKESSERADETSHRNHLVRDNEYEFPFLRKSDFEVQNVVNFYLVYLVCSFTYCLLLRVINYDFVFAIIRYSFFHMKCSIIFLISDAIPKLQFTGKSCNSGKQIEKGIKYFAFYSMQPRQPIHKNTILKFYISDLISVFFFLHTTAHRLWFSHFFCFMCSSGFRFSFRRIFGQNKK